MVTGQAPFGGSAAEIMYQHQHAPLPLARLKDVPQPVVVLLEKLLEKDPSRRFQSPVELLKAIPTITGALDARRRIARQSLQKRPSAISRAGTRKPPARLTPKKISVARLPVTGSDIFGREEDIAFLDRAWANKNVNVVTIVAWAGVGNPHSSTIGFDGWLLNTIAPRSSSLAGPFTDRAVAGRLPQQMNFLMPLSLGLATQIRGSEPPGRRERDSRNSSRIAEPCLFWTAWSRSKTRLVHKKDGYLRLLSRRFCANSLPLIRGFA